MTTITLTYGLPASGKSHWAKEQVANSDGKIVRVNMDDIREMLGLPYSPESEAIAVDIQNKAILAAVKADCDVIVDNTHLDRNMPQRIKRLFDGEVLFKIQDFSHISVADCMAFDAARGAAGGRTVGGVEIRRMAGKLKSKNRITEEWMNDIVLSPPYTPKPGSSAAIIVDIDGTLAKHVARKPHDYSRVLTDEIIEPIRRLVQLYSDDGYEILITTGRPGKVDIRFDTITWLNENNVPFDALFMRPPDRLQDNDADIKQYLFDTYIRDEYWVHLVLDDRDRVVRRWRKLGLTVPQVNYGDF